MKNRILFSDNGSLIDHTSVLENYHLYSANIPMVLNEDYLYIGSSLPFNHLYFKIDTVNSNASDLSLDIWNGTQWNACAEIIDETSIGGVTFAKDGFITWTPDKLTLWGQDDTRFNGIERVTGLGQATIYDKYWIRLSVSSDLSPTTALGWVGNIFSTDDDIGTEFPDLLRSNTLNGFETGKTDWEEQAVRAAKIIVNDLIDMKLISGSGQILERHQLMPASVMKTAEIIFGAFGDDFRDDKVEASKEYKARISKNIFTLDRDNDAIVDDREQTFTQAKLVRGPLYREGF